MTNQIEATEEREIIKSKGEIAVNLLAQGKSIAFIAKVSGLPPAKLKKLDKDGVVSLAVKPKVGTKLLRKLKGIKHEVLVVKGGFIYQGEFYKSLSHIGRQITQNSCNGPLFFGLRVELKKKLIHFD